MSTPPERPRAFWRPRLTIRARLTLTYAGLVTGCGAALIAVIWVFMRFVPVYAIASSVPIGVATGTAVPGQSASTDASADSTMVDTDSVEAVHTSTWAVTSAGDFLQLLLFSSIVALTILALLSAVVGWVVAGRVIRPLKTINEAATLAATGSLDHRVGLQGPHDEIRDLSDTFDSMLGALSRSFESHRRFAANASHELRTPLATTQTMIDVALTDPEADADSLRAVMERIRVVNRANAQTVESLLDLADIGQRPLAVQPVDLFALVEEVIDAVGASARCREVAITLHPAPGRVHPVVAGDPVLLRQCLGNLLQNAVRHNHRAGTVDVRIVIEEDAALRVTVTNTGDRLPDDLVETLLEPFVRGAGRTSGTTAERGRGLGLAIAASVAEAHKGTVRLSANPDGGVTAELRLPREAG